MPYMHKVNGKSVRNYKMENEKYNSKPEQIKARSERTTTRRQDNAAGLTHLHDGTNIDHIKPLSKGGKNVKSNERIVPASINKSFSRNADGSMKKNDGAARAKKK